MVPLYAQRLYRSMWFLHSSRFSLSRLLPDKKCRFHYTFNLRDISKVFQGFLMITAPRCTTVETAVRLWAHECSRVFYDRLINREDQQWFEDLVVELLPRYLKVTAKIPAGQDSIGVCVVDITTR